MNFTNYHTAIAYPAFWANMETLAVILAVKLAGPTSLLLQWMV